MNEELKACPFCGGSTAYVEAGCYAHCPICGADGPVFDAHPDDDWMNKTIRLWNTRTIKDTTNGRE